jgi:TonB family protein
MKHLITPLLVIVALTSVGASQAVMPWGVHVTETIMAGLIVTKVAPVYPPRGRQAHIQGTVILKVKINTSGDVESMPLISGHPMLAPAAIEAIKQWQYKPYLSDGDPVNVETQVRVNFPLSGNRSAEGVVGDAPGGIPPDTPGGVSSLSPVDAPT